MTKQESLDFLTNLLKKVNTFSDEEWDVRMSRINPKDFEPDYIALEELLLRCRIAAEKEANLKRQRRDYRYFKKIRSKLLREHYGELVAIKNKNILGFSPTMKDLFLDMKNVPLGTFIIQRCVTEEEDTVTIHTPRFCPR